jgi:hypothetical protein
MAALNLAGTGDGTSTGSAVMTLPGLVTVTLNGVYSLTVHAGGMVYLNASGSPVIGPVSQSTMQQLWQDVSQVGLIR